MVSMVICSSKLISLSLSLSFSLFLSLSLSLSLWVRACVCACMLACVVWMGVGVGYFIDIALQTSSMYIVVFDILIRYLKLLYTTYSWHV